MKMISCASVILCFIAAAASAGDVMPGKPTKDHLRIITYNVLKGTAVATIADVLRPYHADVILLQEVDQGTRRARSEDQPAELKRLLKMHAFYAPSYEVDGGTTGEMILARFPLARTGVLALPRSRNIGALAAIDWRDLKLLVISVHLSATFKADVDHIRDSAAARVREAKKIAAVASESDRLAVVGGDFNCTPGAEPFKHLAKGLNPVSPGASLPSRIPLLAFDYFFVDKSLAHEQSFVGPRSASDHRAVVVDISPPMDVAKQAAAESEAVRAYHHLLESPTFPKGWSEEDDAAKKAISDAPEAVAAMLIKEFAPDRTPHRNSYSVFLLLPPKERVRVARTVVDTIPIGRAGRLRETFILFLAVKGSAQDTPRLRAELENDPNGLGSV